jgi:hypothetical protein
MSQPKKIWQEPEIVDIGTLTSALGYCRSGTSATSTGCTNGSNVGNYYCGSGTAATNICVTGYGRGTTTTCATGTRPR